MKPLILDFTEIPTVKKIDNNQFEYSDSLNLSVVKGTFIPAIRGDVNMSTETFTKAFDEDSDTDKSGIRMETETRTFTTNETSDSDSPRYNPLMVTQTITEAGGEPLDSDK